MKWFKFYGQDYISDPKMLSLTASERSCWLTLLCYSSVNDNGMITFLDEQQLMIQAGVSPMHEEWQSTLGILKKLVKLGIIEIDNNMITVKNWQKRQETSLTSYERVKRFRAKKRNDNALITLEENRVINDNARREEKRREKNTNTSEPSSPEVTNIIDAFAEVNQSYKKWFANTTQRAACKRLLDTHGLGLVLSVIKLLPKTNSTRYLPSITSPIQLEDKWAQLEAGLRRKKDTTIGNGRGLA